MLKPTINNVLNCIAQLGESALTSLLLPHRFAHAPEAPDLVRSGLFPDIKLDHENSPDRLNGFGKKLQGKKKSRIYDS